MLRAHLLRTLSGAALLGLGACVAQPASPRQAARLNAPGPAAQASTPAPGRRIALLLPLTGANAEIGQVLLRAAKLSLDAPGAPQLDVRDTGGTPAGAADAARDALAAGAGIILGPLTAPETGSASPLARAAGVPMLAFTSDATLAQPGVWTLGITPAQQVRRLVLAVQAENKTRLAAVVPTNPFGDALGTAVTESAAAAGLPPPRVLRIAPGFATATEAIKTVSDGASRHPNEAPGKATTPDPAALPAPPPPLDALFLGLGGDLLGQVLPVLGFYDVGPSQVRLLGPATWARDAARLPGLSGAWYAAPDPAQHAAFDARYAAAYKGTPRDFASIAYDAAGIARAAATPEGFPVAALTRPEGFLGADGLVGLQADGKVRRGLAIFEVDRGGAHVVQPGPQSFAAPGS